MRYSIEGYRRNSPDKDRDYNIIPSGHISMKGVDFPIIGIDEYGVMQYMHPGQEYFYPGNRVLEIPEKQYEYSNNKSVLSINDRRSRFVEHVLNNQDKFDKSTINKAKYMKNNILNKKQDGGQMQQEIIEAVKEYIKKGATPEQLIAELQKQGASTEEAKKVVMIAMSQLENNSVMNYGANPNEMNESYGQEEAYPYYELGSVTMGLDTFGKHNALPWVLPENTFGTAFKAIMGLREGIRGSVMGYKKLYDTIKGENKDIGQSTGDVKAGGASELAGVAKYLHPSRQTTLSTIDVNLPGFPSPPQTYSLFKKDGGYHLPKAQFAGTMRNANAFLPLSPEQNMLDMTNLPQAQNIDTVASKSYDGIGNPMYNPFLGKDINSTAFGFNPNQFMDKPILGDPLGGKLYDNYESYNDLQSFGNQNNSNGSNNLTNDELEEKNKKKEEEERKKKEEEERKKKEEEEKRKKEEEKRKEVEGFSDADRAIAGFRMFNEALSDRDYANEYKRMLMRTGNTDYRYNPMNPVNPYGEYTPNVGVGANYALVGNTPIQDFGTKMASAKYGKMIRNYKEGGEYTISKEELDYILANGGEVEFL